MKTASGAWRDGSVAKSASCGCLGTRRTHTESWASLCMLVALALQEAEAGGTSLPSAQFQLERAGLKRIRQRLVEWGTQRSPLVSVCTHEHMYLHTCAYTVPPKEKWPQ